MNPVWEILQKYQYESWDIQKQDSIRREIVALDIGIVNVKFTEETSTYRVTPVFANEKDWLWYNLKYGNTL